MSVEEIYTCDNCKEVCSPHLVLAHEKYDFHFCSRKCCVEFIHNRHHLLAKEGEYFDDQDKEIAEIFKQENDNDELV